MLAGTLVVLGACSSGTSSVNMAPHLGDRVVRLGGHHKQATFAAFTVDDRLVVSLGDDESALSWDVKTGKLVSAHAYQAGEQVAFSRDGALIAESMYFGTDSSATIWDAVSATKRVSLPGDGKNVWAIAFSPDGSRVALTNNAHQLRVFDSSSGALLATLEGVNEFKTPSFSPDGSHIAAIANDDEDIFVFAIDATRISVLCPRTRFGQGIVTAETFAANTMIAASYTPGSGNIL